MTPHVNHVHEDTCSIISFRNKTYHQNARFILRKMAEIINFWCYMYITEWFTNDKGKYTKQESLLALFYS